MDLPFFKIAQNLNIASSTAHRIYKRFEETGEVEGKKPQSRENLRKLSVRNCLLLASFLVTLYCTRKKSVEWWIKSLESRCQLLLSAVCLQGMDLLGRKFRP